MREPAPREPHIRDKRHGADDAVAGASVGMPVTVRMDGIGASLIGVIARIDHNGTFVKFEMNEAAAKQVEDLVGGRRAA
jgi:hypothetical protein